MPAKMKPRGRVRTLSVAVLRYLAGASARFHVVRYPSLYTSVPSFSGEKTGLFRVWPKSAGSIVIMKGCTVRLICDSAAGKEIHEERGWEVGNNKCMRVYVFVKYSTWKLLHDTTTLRENEDMLTIWLAIALILLPTKEFNKYTATGYRLHCIVMSMKLLGPSFHPTPSFESITRTLLACHL